MFVSSELRSAADRSMSPSTAGIPFKGEDLLVFLIRPVNSSVM